VKYPKDVSKDFLKEFKQLMNEFDTSLKGHEAWW
jgi:hypothetical protein